MEPSKARRMLIIRAKLVDEGGDVAVGHFVRPVWGGFLGLVESLRIDNHQRTIWATVFKVNSHGYREIIEAKFLKRVCDGETDL